MSTGYRVAIVGATGVVGQKVLRVLEERSARFPVAELVPFASPRSEGTPINFRGEEIPCRALSQDETHGFHLVFSSAGGDISLEWADVFAARGAIVIDKSSAFRKEPDIPLVVPEVNPEAVSDLPRRIIASPNCSTTQLVVALNPLHKEVGIERLVIATYQAVSGTGKRALEELDAQSLAYLNGDPVPTAQVYPHPIAFNALAQAGSFLPDDTDRTDEEQKLTDETRRILNDESIRISATCVRVPVHTCHSEAVNVELRRDLSPEDARQLLEDAPGVTVVDNPTTESYPTALDADDRDGVFVGRIRRDPSQDRTLDLWVVADNLRKGAATNAVEIAELLDHRGLLTGQSGSLPQAAPEPIHA